VLSRLRFPRIAASVGGVESLAVLGGDNFTHYMSAEEAEGAGISAGLTRVSVGLESLRDLMADVD
jgi:methionine-gamma-lyase